MKVDYFSYDSYEWINDFFDVIKLCKKKSVSYFNVAASFDIETTNIPYHVDADGEYVIDKDFLTTELQNYVNTPVSFMWHWQVAFKRQEWEVCVTGRKWNEFIFFINTLQSYLNLGEKRKLVFYVHNLAFEFQFIQYFFTWESVFARKPRKVMKCTSFEGFEFRCSYFLSNMSLQKFCENTEGVVHQKMKGDLDYNKYRDWSTKITKKEFGYCVNDVLGLAECIDKRLEDDTIVSIPLTSTGYVRRDVRNACFENKFYREIIKKGFPKREVYELSKLCFRGGDTCANYRFSGKIIEHVYSKDIKSGYPAWILYHEYPVGQAMEHEIFSLERYGELIQEELLIMEVEFFDLEVNFDSAMCYVDIGHTSLRRNVEENNGRVMKADYIMYYCTSIDFDIIVKEYSFSGFNVTKCYGWKKRKLPREIREKVFYYFSEKTKLDGIKEKKYEYTKKKNSLNSCYGMMVTALDNDDILWNDGEWSIDECDIDRQLERVKKSYNTFLLYQWGIFITAYARMHLHEMLEEVGLDSIYSDTDSIKFIGEHNLVKFDKYNKRIFDELIVKCDDVEYGAYTKDGKKEIMGLWEDDGCYEEFKTLGAKKYCVKEDGKYMVTVSGMPKEKGSKKIKSMDDFVIGKVFDDIGKFTSFYNDNKPFTTTLKGREIMITPNVSLRDTTYTLGISNTYMDLILNNLI